MADLSYEGIEIGKVYGPWKYPLKERIARYLEAVEDAHPWHQERSPWGPPVAPPSILGVAAERFMESIAPVPPGTLHAKQEIETAAALRLDRQPIGYGRFVEKFEKRGRRWFVFESRWRDETGLLIGHSRVTMAMVKEEGMGSEEQEEGNPAATKKPKAERKGELTPVVRTLTEERMTAYSEDSANALRGTSIHVQAEAAKKAGFETTVAQGLMCADYISEMMEEVLGAEWYAYSNLSLAFLRPVLSGETVTANGLLGESAEDGGVVRKVYEVWCENERREAVAAGKAGALVRRG